MNFRFLQSSSCYQMSTRSGKLYHNNIAKEKIIHGYMAKYWSEYHQIPICLKAKMSKEDIGINNVWFMHDDSICFNRIRYHYWSPTFQPVIDKWLNKFPNFGSFKLNQLKELFKKAKPELTDLSWVEYYC